jgi:hypothetical protein
MIRAVTFIDPIEGRTRMEIKSSHNLSRVINIVCNFDPVLELEDGSVLRVFQGGSNQDHLYMRVDADVLIEEHEKKRNRHGYLS